MITLHHEHSHTFHFFTATPKGWEDSAETVLDLSLLVHYSTTGSKRAEDLEWLQHSAAVQFNLQYLLAAKWYYSIMSSLSV